MGSPADLVEARRHAEDLVAAVKRHGGPSLKVWQKPGIGTRVYFPQSLGFASVSRGGDVTIMQRGRQTLAENALYPSWYKAWQDGLSDYRRSMEEFPMGGKRRRAGGWTGSVKLIPTGDAYADNIGVVSSLADDLATMEEVGNSKAVDPKVGRLLLYIARAVKHGNRRIAKQVYDSLSESQTYLVPHLVRAFIHSPQGGKKRHSSAPKQGLGKLAREVKGMLR